jgi:hypothetical protein
VNKKPNWVRGAIMAAPSRRGAMPQPVRMRRRVALVAILAILFQAILFGWHHHLAVLAAHGAQQVAHGASGTPLSPATADDDCDICQTLHNLSGSPVEFAVLVPPGATASALHLPDLALVGRGFARAFQARAPPRA